MIETSDTFNYHAARSETVAQDSSYYLSPQDSLLSQLYCEVKVSGQTGILRPYQLQTDNGITSIVLLSFFVLAYILASSKRFLYQQIKSIFYHRNRPSLFTKTTHMPLGYRFLLIVNTGLTGGLLLFNYLVSRNPQTASENSFNLLGFYVGSFLIYYLIKKASYTCINWIFFDKERVKLWNNIYFIMFVLMGIVFYPLALLSIYFHLSDEKALLIAGIFVLFVKMLLFYKCTNIFFRNLYHVFYLIVYFCGLEIIPCLLLWNIWGRY